VAENVRDVLNRRTDLSTFVVHLTRDGEDRDGFPENARERLESIVNTATLLAGRPFGLARELDDDRDPEQQSQRVVCFTETPLEHIYSHVVEISGRELKFEPYGIALTKMTARRLGINPVWYVDQTVGRDWDIANSLNALKDEAVEKGDFHHSPISHILPFIESMGDWRGFGEGKTRKEFWWEREWRCQGSVLLPAYLHGCLVLCPADEIEDFENILAEGAPEGYEGRCIDPRWGLEQIVARLAGIPDENVTPFAPDGD
jgi:hypothetical protein